MSSVIGPLRMRRSQRMIGWLVTPCFAAMWLFSVTAALLNPDGSFARPLPAVSFFTAVFGGFTALGVWLILWGQRYRLTVRRGVLEQVSVLHQRRLSVRNVQQAVWRTRPVGGSLKLVDRSQSVVIEFNNLEPTDRANVIDALKEQIPENLETGWDEFQSRWIRVKPMQAQQSKRMRFLLVAALFAFAVHFGIAGIVGQDSKYLILSAMNVAVGMWSIFRSSHRRAQPGAAPPSEESDFSTTARAATGLRRTDGS